MTFRALLVPLIYALRDWQRAKSPILALILLGGAVTNVMEPVVDTLGGCWHPMIHQDRLFEIMGHPMPDWLLPTYAMFFGVLPMCMFLAFRKGISKRAMWLWFVVPLVADILLEEGLFGISGGNLYAYYGNQPLRLHVFFIWWAPVNAIGVFVPALALALAAPHLRGWRLALVPLCTPLVYGAVGSLAGFPAYAVINSDFPYLVTQLGGEASFLLAGGLAFIGIQLFAADPRWQIRDVLAAGAADAPKARAAGQVKVISGAPAGAVERRRRLNYEKFLQSFFSKKSDRSLNFFSLP